jgi:hypothetical protein
MTVVVIENEVVIDDVRALQVTEAPVLRAVKAR